MNQTIENACQMITALDDVVRVLDNYKAYGHTEGLLQFFKMRLPNGELACHFLGYKEPAVSLCQKIEEQLPEGYELKRNHLGEYDIQEVWEDEEEQIGLDDLKIDLVFKEIGNEKSDFGSLHLVAQTINMNIARIRILAAHSLMGPYRTNLWDLVQSSKNVASSLEKLGFTDQSKYDLFE